MAVEGRIVFEGNPWPDGHGLTMFDFSILLTDRGPRLLLDLQTADYYADDPRYRDEPDQDDDEPDSDWLAKNVWGNYHRCSLSNVKWGVDPDTAPLLSSPEGMLNAALSAPILLDVDPVQFGQEIDGNLDDLAFPLLARP